jgi:glycosyltransferase involved in cell wall biosynthesis
VFFGALAKWQGIDTILEAVARPEWPADLHLVVAGDGAERERVERAAATNAKITYLGRVGYQQMPGVVANSVVALSPKNYDIGKKVGLSPLKVYETLACGVPIVVTDLPGQMEIVTEHHCGVVIPQRDPAALARAVARLHAEPVLRAAMGARGAQTVVREHSWDHRAELTQRILLEAIGHESDTAVGVVRAAPAR